MSATACRQISGGHEQLEISYQPGCAADLRAALAASLNEETRLRVTCVGLHRDDLEHPTFQS